MEKKYQIFISSTYKDLKSARLKVRDAILSMYHFPVGMEMFGALDEEQWEVIKRDIDATDYYVLVIGKMFGSEVPGEGISYTQKEFRYAVAQGIPVLAFIMKEEAEVAKSYEETDKERIQKLNDFKREVETGRTVSYWSNPDELAGQVISSLARQIYRKSRPGWVRTSDFNIEKSYAELLELTQKVKELESENAYLRKIKGEERTPKLSIELFSPISFKISDPDPVPDFLKRAVEERKTYKELGLGNIKTEKEASELAAEYELRSYIMSGFAWLDFLVKNEGTCKASDITIEIDVPKGLMVFENIDIHMYTELNIPGNIIGNRKKALQLQGIHERANNEEFPDGLLRYPTISGWEISGNTIEIDDDEIRHFGCKRCSEFFITASKPGIYKMKCKLMCAEYIDPDYQELIVEVLN